MNDLFTQIKNAILTSKELFEKCKNVDSFCKKYQGKDFDDFSFTVVDRFTVNIKKNNAIADEVFDSSDSVYHSLMNEYLNKLKLPSYHQNRITMAEVFELNFDGCFVLNTKFTIQYSNKSDEFKLRDKPLLPLSEFWEKEMVLHFYSPKNSYELYDHCQENNYNSRSQGGIIGYTDDEKKTIGVISKSNKFYVILRYLNDQLKVELLPIIKLITLALKNDKDRLEIENQLFNLLDVSVKIDESFLEMQSDKYTRVSKEKGQYLIDLWLDKNCPVEFRKIIGNFTNHQYWDYTPYEGNFAFSYLHLTDNDFEYTPDFEFKFRKIT